ncbi:MAG: hypothetical protein E6Q97_08210 [Desulfurellales bacterium]|nr:MAG: hypothetical protein E6Q97_08210 [Desulfurellales bacterium]
MARNLGPEFKVEGLRDLRRDLRDGAGEVLEDLKKENRGLAEDVAERARQRVYPAVKGRSSRGTVIRGRRSSKGTGLSATKGSIRASSSATESRVSLGGPSAPAALGHEFGGGARPQTRQFPPHRGRDGYFFYPSIREATEGLEERYGAILERVLSRRAFPN